MSNGLYTGVSNGLNLGSSNGIVESHSSTGLNYIFTKPGIIRTGLNFYYDPANKLSYPGTGTTMFNLIRANANATLTGITHRPDIAGGVMEHSSAASTLISVPGSTTLWTAAFTWNIWMVYWGPGTSPQDGTQLQGVFWSEATTKNILFGAANTWWVNTFNNGYWRLDSSANVYQSNVNGTVYQGGVMFSPKWRFITITRSGNNFNIYIDGVIRWAITTATYPAYTTSQALAIGNSLGGNFTSQILSGIIAFYNVTQTPAQIYQNYLATKERYENKTISL